MSAEAEALGARGLAAAQAGDLPQGLALLDQALALAPARSETWYHRGNVLLALGRAADALASYDRALALDPALAAAHSNRGVLLQRLGRAGEALESFDRAVAARPDDADAHFNRGVTLMQLGNPQAALEAYDRALAARPRFAAALYNRANALLQLQRFELALESLDQALAVRPDFAEAHCARGVVLREIGDPRDALASFERALEIRPAYAQAHRNRAAVLEVQGLPEEALEAYREAMRHDPKLPFLRGAWVQARLELCDWEGLEADLEALRGAVARGEAACPPFTALAALDSPALQRRAVETYAASKPSSAEIPFLTTSPAADRIRVGYYSGDFRSHAVSFLVAELFETHDRSRFEIHAFSSGADDDDPMRERIRDAVDHFIDVEGWSDAELAARSREAGIDIAVDLAGYTRDGRARAFAMRAAPVQAGYLGYLGTMGSPGYDYLFADRVIVPPEARGFYAEKIVELPSYQANARRIPAAPDFERAALGLPARGFVFCCFSNAYKILPARFAQWMRILKAAEGSVLMLHAGNESVRRNLRAQAARQGVDADRLVFTPTLPVPQYLARFRSADLFLDTLPYNAGTVAADALWMGLPLLTQMGETFAGRVAASLLTAIGLPRLVARSAEEYEALAIALATRPAELAAVRATLERNRASALLFDAERFRRHIEAAFTAMHARRVAGLAPDHIVVPPA